MDLSGRKEWINCNRDIFRKAIRILASRRFSFEKKEEKRKEKATITIEIFPDSVSNIVVQSNTLLRRGSFPRQFRVALVTKQTRINHESVSMYSKFEISTVLRRASKRIRGTYFLTNPFASPSILVSFTLV